MPASSKPQAISGVSPGSETVLDIVYPSLAGNGFGEFLGTICESIPVRIGGIKLSHLLFGLPVGLIAAPIYFLQKIFGSRYVLTNRHVEIRSAFGEKLKGRVALTDIATIDVRSSRGQDFYHAGDLHLVGSGGDVLLTLSGVPHPNRLRSNILETRAARMTSDSSLETIRAREAQQ